MHSIKPLQGLAVIPGDTSAESGRWDGWIKWAAAALAVLGAFVFFAGVGSKSTKQEKVVSEQPQPIATATSSTMTTVRGGHVFGVEIPSSEDSGPG